MKVKGLPYDFEVELGFVCFKEQVRYAPLKGLPAEISANQNTTLLLDTEAEILCIRRKDNDATVLVPLANVASMTPLPEEKPAEAKR